MKRLIELAVAAGLGVAILLLLLGRSLNVEQFTAAVTGLQALLVVPALAVAVGTLHSDSRDRRVDRVIALHTELTSGELQDARIRLVNHLRQHGHDGKVRRVSRQELTVDPILSNYHADDVHKPREDLNRLLRFYERVEATRMAGSLFEPLLVELIGRHAGWMNLAILHEGDQVPRRPMSDLGRWADEYANKNRHRYAYLANWGSNRKKDFGPN